MNRIFHSIIFLLFLKSAYGNSLLNAASRQIRDTSQICYGDLGCFRSDGDFKSLTKRPFSVLPESPKSIDIKFILHLRGKKERVIKFEDLQGIKDSGFNSTRDTKFIIHGFLDNGLKNWIKVMAKELLVHGDYNVIAVDWGSGSGIPYFQATANTRVVGAVIARFIDYLKDYLDLSYDKCHLIGHSLGSHVAGYTGERLNKINRITGLDPAGPYFTNMPTAVRLDPTDAKFVDVIHTDIDLLAGVGFGTPEISGHIDFFPNSGDDQPGCNLVGKSITFIIKGLTKGIRKTFACDHLRVLELFSDSINSKCPFTGIKCDKWDNFIDGRCNSCGSDGSKCAAMGFHADKNRFNSSGSFYLKTSSSLPYCVYNYYVTIQLENHDRSENQWGDIKLTLKGSKGKFKIDKFSDKTLTLDHKKSYSFIVTNDANIGKIESIDFEWESQDFLLVKAKKKVFGYGVKLYVKNIQVRLIDVQTSGTKKTPDATFCFMKNEPIDEEDQRTFYPDNIC